MVFWIVFFLVLVASSLDLGFQSVNGESCSSISQRKEWRTLDRESQAAYIKAVKCLATKPSKLNTEFALRRYDDFQYIHAAARGNIHFVAQFLPWHRHFIFVYQKELRKCGYKGALPRWDWSLDAKNVTAGPVWSSDRKTGFGTNGTGEHNPNLGFPGRRVMDGAFSDLELRHPVIHFLERDWSIFRSASVDGSIFASQYFDRNAIKTVLQFQTFSNFAVKLEGENPQVIEDASPGPHSIIHALAGSEFSYLAFSANEPLFFLHHANIDWIWWRWQTADPMIRMMAYEGNRMRDESTRDATLDDIMDFLGLEESNPTVRESMDTSKFPYCYSY